MTPSIIKPSTEERFEWIILGLVITNCIAWHS